MDSEELGFYYEHLYPYETIYRWLTYNQTLPFIRRQLSFQYENGSVQRYVTFRNAQKMKERMTQLQNIPRKVDAGAIWTGIPTKQNKQDKPQQRQLIFDFDMNDYDDVRTCCQGKTTCSRCWKLLLVAIQIISTCLKEDFGFQKFMYVFSGGRGIHIWVCDQRARLMKDSVRKAIIDYLEVVTGNDKAASLLADNIIKPNFQVFKQKDPSNKQKIKQNIASTMHPHILRSLSVIKKWFHEIFNDQEPLLQDKCKLHVHKNQKKESNKDGKIVKKNHRLFTQYQLCSDAEYPQPDYQRSKKFKRMTFIQEQIQLSFLYPRMDYNVSTMQNHLLKLPFSVHPSTKNISVPLFSHRIHQFNPRACIKLNDLINDLQELSDEGLLKGSTNIQKAKKTRLNQFVTTMQKFCYEL